MTQESRTRHITVLSAQRLRILMSNPYYLLLKQHKGQDSQEGPRKRRKKTPEVIELDSESAIDTGAAESDIDSDDFEDIDLDEQAEQANASNNDLNEVQQSEDESDGDRDFSFLKQTSEPPPEDNITIALQQPEPKVTKKKVAFVSRDERHRRVLMHQLYIGCMICHGMVRNKWCNNYNFLTNLRRGVHEDILDELTRIRRNNRVSTVNSVRFTDVVRQLMFDYSKKFRITKQGLIRKNWNELDIPQANIDKNMTFSKFTNLIMNYQGSRDVAAHGFLALCRSLGMKARLIFSLQPPDFTMVTELPKIEWKRTATETQKPTARNSKQAFVQKSKKQSLAQEGHSFPSSNFPVFWVEIWNKFNKKWLCVDPVVLNVVEQPPMRRKSSFEPPMADPTNNLIYAIAFDSKGGIKDVTRRYAQQYNSRTVKKRIGCKSEELADWYSRIVSFASTRSQLTKTDILELKEFRDRDLAEGMPNNAAGFKDHPIYALESQLRQNEIIFPMDDSTKCGTFRFKVTSKSKKTDLVPVYKRSAVHILRSPKAWYLRGRTLKVGVQPLKTKQAKPMRGRTPDLLDEEDEDGEVTRLYAEFQTLLYIPPPIEDGKITKNAYGNIDIYVPTMIPDGGFLMEASLERPVKLLEQAARLIDIDYAKAIVAFDFGNKNGKKHRKIPTAREGGVLIAKENREAMELVVHELMDQVEEDRRKEVQLNALRNWKFFLTKLRVRRRLEKSHGVIDDKKQAPQSDVSSDYTVHSEDEDSDEFEEGGFVPAEMDAFEATGEEEKHIQLDGNEFEYSDDENDRDGSENEAGTGGFIAQDTFDQNLLSEGGFDRDNLDNEGGFEREEVEPSGGFERDNAGDFENDLNSEVQDGGFLRDASLESTAQAAKNSTPKIDEFSAEDQGNHENQGETGKSIQEPIGVSETESDYAFDLPDEDFMIQDGQVIYAPGQAQAAEDTELERKASANDKAQILDTHKPLILARSSTSLGNAQNEGIESENGVMEKPDPSSIDVIDLDEESSLSQENSMTSQPGTPDPDGYEFEYSDEE